MAITERQSFTLTKVAPIDKPVILSAFDGTANTGQVIKAFCAVCKESDREAVTKCDQTECSFFRYRPWQTETCTRQAIRAQCLTCKKNSRKAIAACVTKACVLHQYRPYQDTPLAGHDPLQRPR